MLFLLGDGGWRGKPSKYVPGVKPSECKLICAAEVMLAFAYVLTMTQLDFHRHESSVERHISATLCVLYCSPIILSILSGHRCNSSPVAPADIN